MDFLQEEFPRYKLTIRTKTCSKPWSPNTTKSPPSPPKKSSTYLKTDTKLKSPKTNKKPRKKPNVMIKSPNLSIEWNHRRRRHRHVGSAEQKSVWDIPRLQRIHELDRQREKYAGDLQQATRVESARMDWMTDWWLKHERQIGSFPQVI